MKTMGKVLLLCLLSFSAFHTADGQTAKTPHLLYGEIGNYLEFGYDNSYLTTVNGGYVFFHRPRIWLAGEANVFKFWHPDYSTLGIGLRPSVRFYPIQQPRYGIYLEAKGGPIYMFPEYEREAINYTLLASVGVDVRLSTHNSLYIGAGYTHYSNGKRWGDARNPTWDGLGGQVGLIHALH